MDQFLGAAATAIISAIFGGFVGSLVTIAKFGSKIDAQGKTLENYANQRREDRDNDRRENERMRDEFRRLCSETNNAREKELEIIRREITDFRKFITDVDRRQRFIMDTMVGVARKLGVKNRITDGLEFNGDDDNG